jgi:hypothetical protein
MFEIVIGVILCLLVVFFYTKWQKEVANRRRKREHELAERKRKKLLDRQENLGNQVFNDLVNASLQNPSGKVKVERLKENGCLGYSIIVGWQEDSSYTMGGLTYRGYPVLQVNINTLRNPQVTISWGPYPNPKDNTYHEVGIEMFSCGPQIVSMRSRVATYSPYTKA